jgi:hypothetical protein
MSEDVLIDVDTTVEPSKPPASINEVRSSNGNGPKHTRAPNGNGSEEARCHDETGEEPGKHESNQQQGATHEEDLQIGVVQAGRPTQA